MNKEISILVDVDNPSTTTNFDSEMVSDYELFLAISHLAVMLQDRGVDVQVAFDDILEGLEDAEPFDVDPTTLN